MTQSRYLEACDNNEGYCTDCKSFTTSQCEPDARNYKCDECAAHKVFGAEESLMMGLFDIDEEDEE